MLTAINPKLPMRDKSVTREFYIDKLGFQQYGNDYDGYLMVSFQAGLCPGFVAQSAGLAREKKYRLTEAVFQLL